MRITDVIERHASERPTAVAVVDGAMLIDWAALRKTLVAQAAHLVAAGLREGDRVALRGPDGAATLIAALAVLHAGGVHAPVDPTLAEPEIAALIATLQTPWRIDLAKGA